MQGKRTQQNGDGRLANFRYRRKWKRLTSVLSIFVVIGTVSSLMLPAITLNQYDCGKEEHIHGESCYGPGTEKVLNCSAESLGLHHHTSVCYDDEGNQICAQADFVVHTHDDRCINADGERVCTLREVREHHHKDDCYKATQIVTDEGHTHTDDCYNRIKSETPTCGKQESEGHQHGNTCLATGTELICKEQEIPGHTHIDSCFKSVDTLTCGTSETAGHGHTEECYDENGEAICGNEVQEAHAHKPSCYTSSRSQTCEIEENQGHTHGEKCYAEAGSLLCTIEESPGHQHDDTCYGLVRGEQICTQEERDPVVEEGEPLLVCKKTEVILHTHKATCFEYDGQGNPTACVCGKTEVQAHQHDDACFEDRETTVLICNLEAHSHTDQCRASAELTQEEQAQVDAVIQSIDALPEMDAVNDDLTTFEESGDITAKEAYTAALTEQVTLAFSQYDALTENQKASVTNAPKLMALQQFRREETLTTLTEDEQAQVDALIAQLDALPDANVLSSELDALNRERNLTGWEAKVKAATEQVQAARTRYEALGEQLRKAVTSFSRLTDLEALLKDAAAPTLTEEEKAPVEELNAQIAVLATPEEVQAMMTADLENPSLLEVLAQVKAARALYDGMTDLQQRNVDLQKLEALEDILVPIMLTEEEWQQVADVNSAIDGLPLIEEIREEKAKLEASGDEDGLNLYLDKMIPAVKDAVELYDALPDELKKMVTHADLVDGYRLWLIEMGVMDMPVHQAVQYTDSSYTEICENPTVTITLTGFLPEGAEVRSYPVEFNMGEEGPVLFAQDITIFLTDGSVYQPQEAVKVEVSGLVIPEHQELDVFHDLEDEWGGMERMDYSIVGDTVTFRASSFSTYAIVDAYTLNRIAEPAINPGTIDSAWIHYWSNAAANQGTAMAVSMDDGFATTALDGEPSDSQITKEGGSEKDDTVTVSKTIDGTDIENVFDITLTVDTTTNITELQKDPDMAVVIVMDISNTMNDAFGGSTRYQAAMAAAEQFLDKFAAANNGYSRIGYVAFNTNAHQIFGLSECSDINQATALKNTMRTATGNIISAASYKDSHSRFTNVEAGLKMGYDMLNQASNANKYIIFLSDGFPTTYIKSGYTGYDPYTSSGTPGTDGVFYDYLDRVHCDYGTSYSDKAAIRAREMAASIKNSGTKIFSIGIDVGGQTIDQYERDTYFSIIDRTSNSYEIGGSSDTSAFKNWLGNSIGSGYYYDSTDTTGLQAAYDKIFEEIKSLTTSANALKWIASDPMPLASEGGEVLMEFIGFYNKNGALQVYKPIDSLIGESKVNGENTISFDGTKSAISWNLKQSGYTTTESGNSTIYHYTVTYRVRLKNELAGFVEHQSYNTNGTTTLTYQEVTVVDGKETISPDKTINFPIPAVKGYLGELTFKKVGQMLDDTNTKSPLAGAVFELKHDSTACPHCRGDGSLTVAAVAGTTWTETSGEDGIVTFRNLPSGHTYTLVETVVPAGYHTTGSTYSVKIAYDKVTVTETTQDSQTVVWDLTNGKTPELVNETNPKLPDTGGAGTHSYTFSGWAMILIACALMYNTKRKQRKGAQ